MKILSRKEILVTSKSNVDSQCFKDIENLNIKILSNDKISITYDPENYDLEKILEIINQRKIHIKDIITQQPDLEEIFKHLIKKQ